MPSRTSRWPSTTTPTTPVPTVSPQPTVRQAPEGSGVTCAWDTSGVTPGDYFIYGITDDGIAAQVSAYSVGTVTVNAVVVNTAPTLTVNQPDGVGDTVTVGASSSISTTISPMPSRTSRWPSTTTPTTPVPTVSPQPTVRQPPRAPALPAPGTPPVSPLGDYFIYGITDDGIAAQVSAYSVGTVTVNAVVVNTAPTLTVNQPDGVGDTVTVGASFDINYDLADAEQDVTVAFYYDTDNTGTDGVAAANCAAAPEGSGVTCAWDTSGVTPGDYFIYGITDDGIAAQVSAYSVGTVTVNAVVVNTAPA